MKLSIGVPFLAAAVVAGWSLVSCGGSDKPPATQAAAPTALSTPVAAAPTNSTSTPATAATPATSPAAAATQTVPPTPVTATEAPASTPTPLTPTPTQPPAPTTAPPTAAPPPPTATPTQPPVPTPTEAPPPTPTPQPVPGISVGVRDNNLFSPRTATVGVGGTVTWVWQGTAYHDIFSRDFPSDPAGVKQTGSYSFTFTRPGTYSYTCEVHDSAGMRGTIIVQ